MELCSFPAIYLVEVMKIMVTSLQRSHACTATLSARNPAAGHHRPSIRQRLPDTHRQVWESLLCDYCSFLLGPSAQDSVVPSKSLFCQSCVSSGGSTVGLMVTSSKRAYAIPKSAAPRTLSLWQTTTKPYLHRRCSNTVLS